MLPPALRESLRESLPESSSAGALSESREFRRVCIKISGEMLGPVNAIGSDSSAAMAIAQEVAAVHNAGIEVCVVVGGGNIFRGGLDGKALRSPVKADHVGMMATVVNALVLALLIESQGIGTVVMSAVGDLPSCLPVNCSQAREALSQRRVVIFGGGLGIPLFTTDSAAAVRAIETGCDLLLKATKVDGIYDRDPFSHPDAKFLPHLRYDDIIKGEIGVMDVNAVVLCRDHGVPVMVAALKAGLSQSLLKREGVFTLVSDHHRS